MRVFVWTMGVVCMANLSAQAVTIQYENWRGESAERHLVPQGVRYGSSQWHPEPQPGASTSSIPRTFFDSAFSLPISLLPPGRAIAPRSRCAANCNKLALPASPSTQTKPTSSPPSSLTNPDHESCRLICRDHAQWRSADSSPVSDGGDHLPPGNSIDLSEMV